MAIIDQGQNRFYVWDKIRGLNSSGDKFNLGTDWLVDVLNGYIEINSEGQGAIQQRYGLTALNSTAIASATTKIRFLTEIRWDGGTRILFCRAGAAWYYVNETTGVATSLDAGRTADAKGQAVKWYDTTAGAEYVLMADGGTPRKCTNAYALSNLTADANAPTDATAVWVHGSRVWLNSAAAPMKVYASKAGDAVGGASWTGGADSLVLDLQQYLHRGDKVLGFRSLGKEVLVIFCKKQILMYYAPATFANIEVVQNIPIATLSNNAILRIANDYAFPSDTGIKSLVASESSQDLDISDLSRNISTTYRGKLANEDDFEAICAGFDPNFNHYLVTIHNGTIDSDTFVYGVEAGEFVGRYQFHINPYSYCDAEDNTFYVGADNGIIYKMSSTAYNDASDPINFKIEFPPFGGESQNVFKHPRMAESVIETNKTATFYLDFGFGFLGDSDSTDNFTVTVTESYWRDAVWRSSYWRGKTKTLKRTWNLKGRGRIVNCYLRHETLDVRTRISLFTLKAILGGEK